jgi:hypothetical protein
VEWDAIVSSLIGSSPATALCALAVRALWTRLRERDADLAECQAARIEDLRTILELSSSGNESRMKG